MMIKEIKEHRSIRQYKSDPIPEKILEQILTAGTRASTTGNMQIYSMVVTTSQELREKLAPLHFNQPCVTQAPVLITFCADINRFSKWCRQRGAEPEYDNFMWYVNAAIDASLASQNVALQAQANGLGIVYLGTPLYNAEEMSKVLNLPKGVIPITAIAMGYPDANPPLTDRLPLEAVVHRETYKDYSPEDIERLYKEREASEETKRLIEENGLENLAKIFTERRYTGEDNVKFSKKYFDFLKKQGFLNQ